VKYAVVDRADGFSRDLYASPDALDALSRDRKTRAPQFEAGPDDHLIRSKDERILHLMRKIQAGSGSQNWTFGGFDPCHQAALVSAMAFCAHPGRQSCAF
jgi:hypothetical protein